MGIEPTRPAWKAGILPLNYTRTLDCQLEYITISAIGCQEFLLLSRQYFILGKIRPPRLEGPALGQTGDMKWIWCFYLYSVLGFLLELVYARATGARKRDRKCHFFLPVCPVYGLGATAIALLPAAIAHRPLLLFPAAAVLATGAEYAAALFYEKVWHVSFWDYHTLPGNVQGRICLPFSLIWGALGLGLRYFVQPLMDRFITWLPEVLLLPITLLFTADFLFTGLVLRRRGSTEALRWYRR